jgi:phage terminase large subunit-like protein
LQINSTPSGNDYSLAEALALQGSEAQRQFVEDLTESEARYLEYDWKFWARPKQQFPEGNWQFWMILAGRGFGKTRCGAQWVIDQVQNRGKRRLALVAETASDARDVMVEGESGLLACSPPWFYPKYEPSKRRLTWPNGARATTYTAEKPDQLRGPQHDGAWADEPAKWRYADAWDQLMFGLRLGNNPQCCLTTTPRPTPLIKTLVKDPLSVVTRGTTYENKANLSPQFLQKILRKYEGTRLGRQELNAEILDDAPGALWQREAMDEDRCNSAPLLTRIVVAVDPSVSSDSEEAETGIVVAGLGSDRHGYVLADGSLEQPTPQEWGKQSVSLYSNHRADRIIGEVNNGGDLVEMNIRAVDPNVSYKAVHASRGKQIRAEPIAALYEQHRVHHVGFFPKLEDQMCQWEPGVSTWSPNRVDALVWALTELMLEHSDPGRALIINRKD